MAVQHEGEIEAHVLNDIDKLNDINKRQEKQIQCLETKAIQLTNLYFVFQGVILSSISSTSPVKCHKWWVPFCLSLIAAVINLVSVYGTIGYYLKCRKELDQNYEDLQMMRQHGLTRAKVNAVLPGSTSPIKEKGTIYRPMPDPFELWKRWGLCYAAFGLLLGFSGIILYGCRGLLCDAAKD